MMQKQQKSLNLRALVPLLRKRLKLPDRYEVKINLPLIDLILKRRSIHQHFRKGLHGPCTL